MILIINIIFFRRMSSAPRQDVGRPTPASGAKAVALLASRCYAVGMNRYLGLLIGVATLAIIVVSHPIVIKFRVLPWQKVRASVSSWALFVLRARSWLPNQTISALIGILGFTFFWSIKELFEQEKRVQQGRFPRRSR